MELTRKERWLLSNQYRILALLDAENAAHYDEVREILESGYELMYAGKIEHIYDGGDVTTATEGEEVLDILDMFDSLQQAYDAMEDKDGIEAYQVTFHGFDGNSETKQMGFARFFCKSNGGRYTSLRMDGDGFNSHMPLLNCYRRQLVEFRRAHDLHNLTPNDVRRIVHAAIHPDSR